jgi:preprotein translocase subunit SecF
VNLHGARRVYDYVERRWGKPLADKVVLTLIAVLFAVMVIVAIRMAQS